MLSLGPPSLQDMLPAVDRGGRLASMMSQEKGGGDGRQEAKGEWEFARCREELEGERAMRARLSLELSKATSELELLKVESEDEITALLQEKKHLLLQIESLNRELEATEVEVNHLKTTSESLSQEGGSLRAMQTEVSTKAQAYQAELRCSYEEARGRCEQLEHQVELLEGQVREYQNGQPAPSQEVVRPPAEPAPPPATPHGARRVKQQQLQLSPKERESYEDQVRELQDAMDGLQASSRVLLDVLESRCAQLARRLDQARAESQSAITQLEQDLTEKDAALANMAVALKEERLRASNLARDKIRIGVEYDALQRKLHHAVEEAEAAT